MDAIEMLKSRRSVREFETTPVEKSVIEDIVDCGRLAASALNQQPWHFIAVTDEAVRKEIAKIAPNGKYIATAPVCIVTVAKKDSGYKVEDGSAATQNMLNAAKAHGLGSCWVAGYGKPYAEEICKLLGVPENYTLISMMPVGVAVKPSEPVKKPLDEVLSWEKF